ncbi:MAG: 3-phosphoshikimate 1-carboxyvinyltransferase [Treponema sp.]
MNITGRKSTLSGKIRIPGSKSHTIRALLFAALADGVSRIKNPLDGEDCVSAARAARLFGAEIDISSADEWIVNSAGKDAHLPDNVVDVGNSGSLLYFMAPIAATFDGWSVFTGDSSIRKRPVLHLADALRQLGAQAYISRPDKNAPPLIIKGPARGGKTVVTGGELSQYVSGMMMAALHLEGSTKIDLTAPKETPFLHMTQLWLESFGADVRVSGDFKHIEVRGKKAIPAFDRLIPSDWEAAAFPLVAALITGSEIVIENVDVSGSQGDEAVTDVLRSLGARLEIENGNLHVLKSRLSARNFSRSEMRVNLSGFPDALCALAAAACFTEGTCVFEDIAVCRSKETDRIAVMQKELSSLGAKIEAGDDYLAVHGQAQFFENGEKNPAFRLHGGAVESHGDHRVAMALSCLSLALPEGETLTVNNAECAAVSFPNFYEAMRSLGADFTSR